MTGQVPALYKVLVEGRSPHIHSEWSVPSRGKPGEWKEVAGPLRQWSNGLHLTADPVRYRRLEGVKKAQCYLAETEGDVIHEEGDHEYVARKARLVRRVPWSEFKWVDPEPEADSDMVLPRSPAFRFLEAAWKAVSSGSYARINDTMKASLLIAVRGGMEFDPDDFTLIAKQLNSGYWIGKDGMEHIYAIACGNEHRDHGGNPSAVNAYEKRLNRVPFLVRVDPGKKSATRLYVGASFEWWDGASLTCLHVTSIHDADGYIVAVERKHEYDDKGYHSRTKIVRTFKITHADIKAYHGLLREREDRRSSANDSKIVKA